MTTTPLPPPDTHCFDEDTNMDVWSYSAPLVEQIVKQARADLDEALKAEKNLHGITGKAYAKAVDDYLKLEAENAKLREELAALRKEALEPLKNATHRCIKCLHAYRPDNGESEDCPACGHDGAALERKS